MSELRFAMGVGQWLNYNQDFYYRLGASDAWIPMELGSGYGGSFYSVLGLIEDYGDFLFLLNDTLPSGISFTVQTDPEEDYYGSVIITKTVAHTYFEISSRSDGATQNIEAADNFWFALFPSTARSGQFSIALSGAGEVVLNPDGVALGGSFWPYRYLATDIEDLRHRSSQAVGAGVTTVSAGTRRLRRILLQLRGYPRAMVENEYHQLVDFLDLAAGGAPVFIFTSIEDSDSYNLYQPYLHPFGVQVGYLKKGEADWSPAPSEGDWEEYWEKELTFHTSSYVDLYAEVPP